MFNLMGKIDSHCFISIKQVRAVFSLLLINYNFTLSTWIILSCTCIIFNTSDLIITISIFSNLIIVDYYHNICRTLSYFIQLFSSGSCFQHGFY